MAEYIITTSHEEYEVASMLFIEYAQWLAIDLCFQNFDKELKDLKEAYSINQGGIILCKEKGNFIGCVAIRRITNDVAELKRMFVQPVHQKKGFGRKLLENAIKMAENNNYSYIRLDTLDSLTSAIKLYKQFGFYEIEPYYFNPNPTVVFMEIKLNS